MNVKELMTQAAEAVLRNDPDAVQKAERALAELKAARAERAKETGAAETLGVSRGV